MKDKKDRFWFWAFVVFATIVTAINIYKIWAVPAPTVPEPAVSESKYFEILVRDSINDRIYRVVFDSDTRTGVEYYWGEDRYIKIYPLYDTIETEDDTIGPEDGTIRLP